MNLKELLHRFRSSRSGEFVVNFSVVLVFTLSLSWLLDYDPYSLIEGGTDYNSGDYYDRLYHDNTTLRTDTTMVIVASDHIPNDSLAAVLRQIGAYGACAIGFDLVFRNETSITDELIDVIDSLPQIVMPVELELADDSGNLCLGEPSLLNEYLGDKVYATVSFPPRPVMSFQREVFLKAPVQGLDSIESFALVLAKMKRPGLNIPDVSNVEAVNFNISDVEVIDYEEFRDPELSHTIASLIDGRIVLVGDVLNKYDVHPTAVDDNMPGIKLHAAAIATLLSGRPVRPLPRVWSILFMILCVGVVTWADAYYSDKDDFRKGLGFLGIKGAMLLLMLVGGYALYIYHGVRSDFTYSLTLFMFSMVIADLWFGFRDFMCDRKQKKNLKDNQ